MTNTTKLPISGGFLLVLIIGGLGIALLSSHYQIFQLKIRLEGQSQLEVLTATDEDMGEFFSNYFDYVDLPQVIQHYDQVVLAIVRYHIDQGTYPESLSVLVPEYLQKQPDIIIRAGEELRYSPAPRNFYPVHDALVKSPFTFYVYGHYPGPASMHGWHVMYCPERYEDCNYESDRHTGWWRINTHWVWINGSAL
jgi:hypothetical protein